MGCGGDTGPWDPLITDMGWILGSMGSHYGGVEVTQGCGTPWLQIWDGIWGLWGVEVKRGLGTPWLQIWGGIWGPGLAVWGVELIRVCRTPWLQIWGGFGVCGVWR